MTYLEALRLAGGVRRACRKFAMTEPASGYDFFQEECLECMCAVASQTLRRASGCRFNVAVGTFNGDSHCWCEWSHWRWDLTATQFSGIPSPVLVTRLDNPHWSEVYVKDGLWNRYRDIDWGTYQNPTPKLVRAILLSS